MFSDIYYFQMKNEIFESFNQNNFSKLVNATKPLWSYPEWEDSFRNFYTEIIIRNSYFDNDIAYQMISQKEKELLSVIFFQKKSDKNHIHKWILENSQTFTLQQKECIKKCVEYLDFMEKKVHAIMNEDDIKLSLFVTMKKGYGAKIFEKYWYQLMESGFKNMYLWTDCECNWKWYQQKGFTLVEEATYSQFNDEKHEFKTYIFKKQIT